jgi:type VI secretion system secreted protein Hcp
MAVDAFITFESVITGLKPEAFEIRDFSFGVESPTTIGSATSGAGAGKVKFNEFTIKKTTDKSSPAFFKNCCAGVHYKSVTISMRRAGETAGREFLRFKFDTVFTTKIDWSGPGDEGPEESVTFVYGKLGIKVTPPETDLKPVVAGWDQVMNKAADDFAGA